MKIVPLDSLNAQYEMVPVATIAAHGTDGLGVIISGEHIRTDQALALDRSAIGSRRARCPGASSGGATPPCRAQFVEVNPQADGGAGQHRSFGKASDPASLALLEGRIRRPSAMGIDSHDIAVEAVMSGLRSIFVARRASRGGQVH